MAVVPSVTAQGTFTSRPMLALAISWKGCHPNYFNVAWQNDTLYEAAVPENGVGYKSSLFLS